MDTKKMTEQESLALITAMIESTKQRYRIEDGKIYLIWGYTSVLTALAVWLLLWLTHNPWVQFLWFAIPLVGGLLQHLTLSRRQAPYVKTYTDRIIAQIGQLMGISAGMLSLLCLLFHYGTGRPQVWMLMFIYALVIVGASIVFHGIVLKERSMMVGGSVSIFCGSGMLAAALSGLSLTTTWLISLYCVSFLLMFIVPGHIIQAKAHRDVSSPQSSPHAS